MDLNLDKPFIVKTKKLKDVVFYFKQSFSKFPI